MGVRHFDEVSSHLHVSSRIACRHKPPDKSSVEVSCYALRCCVTPSNHTRTLLGGRSQLITVSTGRMVAFHANSSPSQFERCSSLDVTRQARQSAVQLVSIVNVPSYLPHTNRVIFRSPPTSNKESPSSRAVRCQAGMHRHSLSHLCYYAVHTYTLSQTLGVITLRRGVDRCCHLYHL